MNALGRAKNLLITILLFTAVCISTSYSANKDDFHAVPTYECIGLYLKSPDLGQCDVRFRENDASTWRQGYPLFYDPRDNEYR